MMKNGLNNKSNFTDFSQYDNVDITDCPDYCIDEYTVCNDKCEIVGYKPRPGDAPVYAPNYVAHDPGQNPNNGQLKKLSWVQILGISGASFALLLLGIVVVIKVAKSK